MFQIYLIDCVYKYQECVLCIVSARNVSRIVCIQKGYHVHYNCQYIHYTYTYQIIDYTVNLMLAILIQLKWSFYNQLSLVYFAQLEKNPQSKVPTWSQCGLLEIRLNLPKIRKSDHFKMQIIQIGANWSNFCLFLLFLHSYEILRKVVNGCNSVQFASYGTFKNMNFSNFFLF